MIDFMRLYINETTGYFGTNEPNGILTAVFNTILAKGNKEAAKLLGVQRRELYDELFSPCGKKPTVFKQ